MLGYYLSWLESLHFSSISAKQSYVTRLFQCIESVHPPIDHFNLKIPNVKRSDGKRSDDIYRMNHLTRLGDYDNDYEHAALIRGKRRNFVGYRIFKRMSDNLLNDNTNIKDELDDEGQLLMKKRGKFDRPVTLSEKTDKIY